MSSLGNRLRSARERKGWSQTYVCRKLGISNSTLSGYERDYREPDIESLKILADLYEISVEELIQDSENTKQPYYTLTEKDEKDIAKDLERMMNDLESKEGMAFYGEPLDEEDRELLKISLENSLRLARQMAKKKFTPKKYRN
nr:helix-turn-helix transcriptional regulator [Aneurinibacillus sp. XH2]